MVNMVNFNKKICNKKSEIKINVIELEIKKRNWLHIKIKKRNWLHMKLI